MTTCPGGADLCHNRGGRSRSPPSGDRMTSVLHFQKRHSDPSRVPSSGPDVENTGVKDEDEDDEGEDTTLLYEH